MKKTIADYKRTLRNYGAIVDSRTSKILTNESDLDHAPFYYARLVNKNRTRTHAIGVTLHEAYQNLETKIKNLLFITVMEIENERKDC